MICRLFVSLSDGAQSVGRDGTYIIVSKIVYVARGLSQILIGDVFAGSGDESSVGQGVEGRTRGTFVSGVDGIVVMLLIVMALLVEVQRFLPRNDVVWGGNEELVVTMIIGPRR